MLRYGFICEFNAVTGKARVDFKEDGFVSDWLPFLVPFAQDTKMSIPVSINEQVCVLCDANIEDSVILGAIVNNEDKPYVGASAGKLGVKFSDGCLVEYDTVSHELTINALTGKVNITAAEINVTGVLKVTGAATVTGLLAVGGISPIAPATSVPGGLKIAGVIEATGDVQADGKSLKLHTHSGVTVGAGVTGPPV